MYNEKSYMRKKPTSIDGFIPRRNNSQLGEYHAGASSSKPVETPQLGRSDRGLSPSVEHGLRRSDVDDSLKNIDVEDNEPSKKRGLFGRAKKSKRTKKPLTRKQKITRTIIVLVIIAILAVAAFVLIKGLLATTAIFKGNIFDVFQNQPLKQDANGRSNILVFGTSEDDGPDHGGASLTDSIMVVSVNQKKKDAYMVSIPRDLYVQYGQACNSGYAGKVNEVYSCNFDHGKNEPAGADALRKMVGKVTGLDIQYYAHVNYTVVRQAVAAVGGVTVSIEGSGGAPGIMDSNFNWKCGEGSVGLAEQKRRCPPNGNFIEFKNGPANLNAEQALYLAQARGDRAYDAYGRPGSYGLVRGNFDRELNQQKIIRSLREKAASAGTLTNISKVTSLIDALGNNLRTNFETKEIRTVADLGSSIPTDKIKTINLNKDGEAVVTTGQVGAASIVRPVAGLYDYSGIASYIKKQLTSDPFIKEGATVAVLNGSGAAGVAQEEADKLTKAGFTVSSVDNAPAGSYGPVEIYQLSSDKKATRAKLQQVFGVSPREGRPPFTVSDGVDFVVIIGQQRP